MELRQDIIDILVHKIKDKCINPNTGKEYTLEDIKIPEYKEAVANLL